MIPDLMEAEINVFFTNQDEMEITLMESQHSVKNSHDIQIVMQQPTSKAARSSRYGLPYSKKFSRAKNFVDCSKLL